ncbi:hypothetical protein PPL_01017 [Heterostelium album PN500]|uniref:Uncharacterized protein n=1 Tax=Heterostelium pallidum (strain ATCC 26659 / Pp 5 / PN500) TaxID=670386 RepID=D3AXW0_HETP5|nr:hypothetical protein PPL_01017 [Heterostelium album PN500]EFA85787.1 hypothetical protein PPL_01017 [Heterostelium album PN500]|eukprot:XP_020437893.1 hypothetical protein PPL_01017 [Heterostelium album PN500]
MTTFLIDKLLLMDQYTNYLFEFSEQSTLESNLFPLFNGEINIDYGDNNKLNLYSDYQYPTLISLDQPFEFNSNLIDNSKNTNSTTFLNNINNNHLLNNNEISSIRKNTVSLRFKHFLQKQKKLCAKKQIDPAILSKKFSKYVNRKYTGFIYSDEGRRQKLKTKVFKKVFSKPTIWLYRLCKAKSRTIEKQYKVKKQFLLEILEELLDEPLCIPKKIQNPQPLYKD